MIVAEDEWVAVQILSFGVGLFDFFLVCFFVTLEIKPECTKIDPKWKMGDLESSLFLKREMLPSSGVNSLSNLLQQAFWL